MYSTLTEYARACGYRIRIVAESPTEATIDDAAAFAGLDASILYRSSWNMMRLTGRGLDSSSESAEVRVLPDSLSIFLR